MGSINTMPLNMVSIMQVVLSNRETTQKLPNTYNFLLLTHLSVYFYEYYR